MSVIGIVAEYNPFHFGHQYHIRQSKERAEDDSIVICVMSGDFVQRGEAAIYSKFTRAEAACRSGADLVVELPLPWCLASAEGFAYGAVSLLDRLGCTHLSFGSEAGVIEPLQKIAETILAENFNERVEHHLLTNPSLSYAAARQLAVEERCGCLSKLLETPNNILAVEYLKALARLKSELQPLTILRSGSRHDGEGGELKSASELRSMILRGKSIASCIPQTAVEAFRRSEQLGQGSPNRQVLEIAILSRLRALRLQDCERIPDAADGAGRRLFQAASEEVSLDAVMSAAKTKRYALARIRRMICCAVLGVPDGIASETPPYARVLAANEKGREHLSRLRGDPLPIITKPAALRSLGGLAEEVFELGSAAHDLFVLGYRSLAERRGGQDWRKSPFIL